MSDPVKRGHVMGAAGLGVCFAMMLAALLATGSWSAEAAGLLGVALAVTAAVLVIGHLAGLTASRWSLLVWPVATCTAVPVLHGAAPEATALLPGVLVLAFLFVGQTLPPGVCLPLLPPAVLVMLVAADLSSAEAAVRVPIAITIWVLVSELPARLLARLRRQEAELVRLASTDALTGVLNRTGLDQRLAGLGPDDSVVLLDLDHFKGFNDAHGHVAGDEALAAFARMLGEVSRAGDSVVRFGGEEFLMVLPGATVLEAREVLDRLGAELARCSFGLTFSAGVVSGGDQAVHRADQLLYEAKQAGRSRIVTASTVDLQAEST